MNSSPTGQGGGSALLYSLSLSLSLSFSLSCSLPPSTLYTISFSFTLQIIHHPYRVGIVFLFSVETGTGGCNIKEFLNILHTFYEVAVQIFCATLHFTFKETHQNSPLSHLSSRHHEFDLRDPGRMDHSITLGIVWMRCIDHTN